MKVNKISTFKKKDLMYRMGWNEAVCAAFHKTEILVSVEDIEGKIIVITAKKIGEAIDKLRMK